MGTQTAERERLVDVAGLAQLLDTSEKTIHRLVASGDLPHFRVGRQLRFFVPEVLESLRQERTV